MLPERRHEVSRLEAFSDAFAYNKRAALHLTPLEIFDVKAHAGHHLVRASVGLVALAVAVGGPLVLAPLSPTCFALMGPGHWWFGNQVEKRRRALNPTA